MKPALTLAAAIFTGVLAINPVQSLAQVGVNYRLGDAPPPLRREAVPAAREGYVWAPGYWNWNGSRHEWSAGHWERARAGQTYERAEWRQDGGNWKLKKAEWKRNKHDEKHEEEHGEKHDEGVGHKGDKANFCPPGQAKKGNC